MGNPKNRFSLDGDDEQSGQGQSPEQQDEDYSSPEAYEQDKVKLVDFLSVGGLTHSSPIVDIALDLRTEPAGTR